MKLFLKKEISQKTITNCLVSVLYPIVLVTSTVQVNGVKTSFDYDDLHRLTAIQHQKGTEVLSQFNYALNADGKRNTLQEYLKYPAGKPVSNVNRTVFYGYDAAGRLNAEQRQSTSTLTAGGTVANTARTIWTYDKVGNRITQAVSNYDGIGIAAPSVLKSTFNTSYSYNNNDWLLSTNSIRNDESGESTFVTNFEYNANGSQKAVTSNVGKPEEKTISYFYDFEQKLTGIGDPTDTIRYAYAYDADGNRIAESNTNPSGTNVRNYLVDPNNSNAQIVEEYNNANALLAHYDWNDAELLREASWNNIANVYDIHEPLADGHNSIRQLLETTGAISDIYAFDAWGNQQVNIGNAANPYCYNSQRLDASGLYYLRARQYSSGIGRFLSHDPMMGDDYNPVTQHRYLYANLDPVNGIDPSGEFTISGMSVAQFGQRTLYAMAGGGITNTAIDYTMSVVFGQEYGLSDMGQSFLWGAVTQGMVSVVGKGLQLAFKVATKGKPLFVHGVANYNRIIVEQGSRRWATLIGKINNKFTNFAVGGDWRIKSTKIFPYFKREIKDLSKRVGVPEDEITKYMPAFSPNLWSWWKGLLGQQSYQPPGWRSNVLAISEGLGTIVGWKIITESYEFRGIRWKYGIPESPSREYYDESYGGGD